MPATTELHITGMTCASCAARIERKLNRLDGVVATVNYATEIAVVEGTPDVGVLVETVESLGYGASFAAAASERQPIGRRLAVSSLLTAPVLAVSMVPSFQFDHWAWWAFAFSTPVVAWGGWPFHRAALVNARHATAPMDTLISVGSIVAYVWSIYTLVFQRAGAAGMHMRFVFTVDAMASGREPYFEVATGLIVLVLAGRFIEQRGPARGGLGRPGARRARRRRRTGTGCRRERTLDASERARRWAAVRGAPRRTGRVGWRGRTGPVGRRRVARHG